MKDTRRSDQQLFLSSALIILASIGLLVSLAQVAAFVVFPSQTLTVRVVAVGAFGLLSLGASSFVLRDTSVLWQIPLQAIAGSCLAVGAAAVVTTAFNSWYQLLGPIGYHAIGCLAVGLVAAWLMRRLQVRLLPQQDA